MSPIVACPHCAKPVSWTPASEYKPFCSERCRLIDLGDWLSEKHAIPGEDAITPGSDEGDSH
ncbi:MAG: DNA gyrase inhibitor YacG [Gammaproteobacteria bacterium]